MDVSHSMTIADLSLHCKQRFESLKQEVSTSVSNSQDGDPFPKGFVPEDISDLYARFRVWTGNIGALQHNRSSLDHRIRHSGVRNEVIRLLAQLFSALTDCECPRQ